MKDGKFHSHDEIEDAIAVAWNDLAFEDVQSIFFDWIRRLALVIEHEAEYILEEKRNGFFLLSGCGDRPGGAEPFFTPCMCLLSTL
jgi:hypothetical protein